MVAVAGMVRAEEERVGRGAGGEGVPGLCVGTVA